MRVKAASSAASRRSRENGAPFNMACEKEPFTFSVRALIQPLLHCVHTTGSFSFNPLVVNLIVGEFIVRRFSALYLAFGSSLFSQSSQMCSPPFSTASASQKAHHRFSLLGMCNSLRDRTCR